MSPLEKLIEKVNQLLDRGNYSEALPLFEKIIEIDSENVEMLCLFAMTQIEVENFNAAESLLEKALTLQNDNTDCLLQLGYLKHQKGQIAESKHNFSKILKINPDQADALEMMGVIAMNEEDYESALNFLQASNRIEEDFDVMFKILENYLQLDQPDQAKEIIDLLDGKSLDAEQENLQHNYKTWYYLDKTITNWTGTGTDENGEEALYPATLDEILESEIFLSMAKKQQCDDDYLLERLNQIEEVIETHRSKLFRHNRKTDKALIKSLIMSLVTIFALMCFFGYPYTLVPEFSYQEKDFIVRSRTDLCFTHLQDFGALDMNYHQDLPLGTLLKPLAIQGENSIQVENEKGERGFVEMKRLTGIENTVLLKECVLFADFTGDTIIARLNSGQPLTVLSLRKINHEKNNDEYLARVKTAGGKIGYVPYKALEPQFKSTLPQLNADLQFPTSARNLEKKAIGADLKQMEKKYGPARSIIQTSIQKIAFFEQVNFIKNGHRYQGIFFRLDKSNKIIGTEYYQSGQVRLTDQLPLINLFRHSEIYGPLKLKFYQNNLWNFPWLKDFSNKNKVVALLTSIFCFLILTPVYLIFLSFPFLILAPAMVLLSGMKRAGKKLITLCRLLLLILGIYFFIVWLTLLMDCLLVPVVFSTVTFYFWWTKYFAKMV
ncbi:MAG: tetratricopeptide repeat protein [Candidatus Marinimicrobia bacterium]|nr:tetratricopeptide repeat protein [Candidatus Neomarinimicrobiota bacterium]